LGNLEVLRNGPVELLPSKKARALLAYLVATERLHERGQLAGLVWDERDDARAALRWTLSRLRPVVDGRATASRFRGDFLEGLGARSTGATSSPRRTL
jgi:DNA-binding SARP family transcriptional activator